MVGGGHKENKKGGVECGGKIKRKKGGLANIFFFGIVIFLFLSKAHESVVEEQHLHLDYSCFFFFFFAFFFLNSLPSFFSSPIGLVVQILYKTVFTILLLFLFLFYFCCDEYLFHGKGRGKNRWGVFFSGFTLTLKKHTQNSFSKLNNSIFFFSHLILTPRIGAHRTGPKTRLKHGVKIRWLFVAKKKTKKH